MPNPIHAHKAAQKQIENLGQPILHTMPSGLEEWLWGHFSRPPESGLNANGFDFEGAIPVVRLMLSDAVNVSALPRRTRHDSTESSKMLINGLEYTVSHVHHYDNGTVHVQLTKDCKSVQRIAVAPNCLRQMGSMEIDNTEP